MKKFPLLLIALAVVLSAAALAETDTSAWVEMPVGESGYTLLIPGDMTEEELDASADGWTEKDTLIYSARCNDLAIDIGRFEENPTMEDVRQFIDGKGMFESVEINENGILECLGGDDSVSMLAFGNQENGIFCLTVYPLETDPDAAEPDKSLGIEMADIVKNSLKLAEAE